MRVEIKTKPVYNFRNTCSNCFNDIEFPLLGDFSYGELIVQTKDGQDFGVLTLIDNPALAFIENTLMSDAELNQKKADPQKILTLVADTLNGKEFTTDYPICPICRERQKHFNDNKRTRKKELPLATWNDFEKLTQAGKIGRIKEVAQSMK
jgi:hypothetical protein